MSYRLIGISILVTALMLVGGCGGGGEQQGIAATSQTVAPASVVGPAQGSGLLGDLDNDGQASIGDAIRILRIVVGLDDDDPCADANKNGATDVGDAIKVLRCVVGLDDWPLGECNGGCMIGWSEALNAPMPTNPVAATAAIETALQDYTDDENIPDTREELEQDLSDWAARVIANPNDAGAQLGLCMALLATGGNNAACAVGENIFDDTDLQSVTEMAFKADLGVDELADEAIATAMLKATPRMHSGTSNTVSTAATTADDLKEYRQAVGTWILPALASAYERMAAIADAAAPTTQLVAIDDDGELFCAYAAEYDCIAAGMQLIRSAVLMVYAINPDYGDYEWDRDMVERDANQDGILTVAEFAPALPFADVSATSWTLAGTCLRDAVARLSKALDNRQAGDANALVSRALEGEDVGTIDAYLTDATAVFGGQVTFTYEWEDYPYGTATSSARPAQVGSQGISQIPVNLRKLWDNPPANFRNWMPRQYIMLDWATYALSNGMTIDIWYTGEKTEDTMTYEVWSGASLVGTVAVPIAGAPHQLVLPASGGFPGATISANWNWTQITGTSGGISFTGAPAPGTELWTTCQVKWDEIPDKTLGGIFPDSNAIKDVVYGDYDSWSLSYGSFEMGEEPWW
jgi:hypothetical protein